MEALDLALTDVVALKSLTIEQKLKLQKVKWGVDLGIPVARITSRKFFWKDTFEISPFTLEPRQDTEAIVEYIVKHLKPKSILDIGTGTGCILLSLLREFPGAEGVGVDISPKAIEVAKQNADKLKIKADFICTDCAEVPGSYDLIVSNPPYVKIECDISALFDPPVALRESGCYEKVISRRNLKPNGTIVLEVPSYSEEMLLEMATRAKLTPRRVSFDREIGIWALD